MGLHFLQGGMLTTVQDMGRIGYRQYGISLSGVMDSRSAALANALVGNPEGEAVLEMTLLGPTIQFSRDTRIALTGGAMPVRCGEISIPMYTEYLVKAQETVVFGSMTSGCRSYLAVGGGMDLNPVMGSYSTYLKGGIGGFQGRTLAKGDVIALRQGTKEGMSSPRTLIPEDFSSRRKVLRVVLGPQEEAFSQGGLDTFLGETYEVSPQCDRMGYRFLGEKIQHSKDANIISDGITSGSVQVSGDGMPIVMMADSQTTGGYAKIATVISVDLPLLAQSKPRDLIQFEKISVEEAQKLYVSWVEEFKALELNPSPEQELSQALDKVVQGAGTYEVELNGQRYVCTVSPL